MAGEGVFFGRKGEGVASTDFLAERRSGDNFREIKIGRKFRSFFFGVNFFYCTVLWLFSESTAGIFFSHVFAGNDIKDEGLISLTDGVRDNQGLTTLNFWGMGRVRMRDGRVRWRERKGHSGKEETRKKMEI
jgi:hypothetical protein